MNDSQAGKLVDALSTMKSAAQDVESIIADAIKDVEDILEDVAWEQEQAQPEAAQKHLAAMLRGYDNGTWDPVEVAEARRVLFELHDAARGSQPYGGLIPMAW